MIWQWQAWRCFDDLRETFVTKGWRLPRSADDEAVPPLAAEAGGLYVTFLGLDTETGECWFELRAGGGPPAVILRGADNVPAPEAAADLLAERAAALGRASGPHDGPLYEPDAAPTAVRAG